MELIKQEFMVSHTTDRMLVRLEKQCRCTAFSSLEEQHTLLKEKLARLNFSKTFKEPVLTQQQILQ